MARRIIVSVFLTLLVLAAARRFTSGRPEDLVSEAPGLKVYHRTVTEKVGPGQPCLKARIEPAQKAALVIRWMKPPSTEIQGRTMFEIRPGVYEGCLPPMEKGAKITYWIAARNVEQATARVPADDGKFGVLKYKGEASTIVIVAHVVFMFAAFFFMAMSALAAVDILRGREDKTNAVRAARWALATSFVGGWPLGFMLNYQTFGQLWEGFPFGYDITDNKTQVIFVLWLAVMLLSWGSFVGGGEEKDRLGRRAFATAIVACFLVSLALFVVPHSI